MDVKAYLQRLNYTGSLDVNADTLRELHRAHLFSIPFENLDIHLGRRIVLDEELVLHKLIAQRRGGFCYELNGAFCALLRELGFTVSMLSAGVARDEGGFDPPFDHMALLVDLEQRWLADVGFGDSFREPLLLDSRQEQDLNGDAYQLLESGEHLILQRREAAGWTPQYRFTVEPHRYDEYSEMCVYHQTSPQSIFTQRRACSIATADGRITVTDKRLIITSGGEKNEREFEKSGDWLIALREYFDIDIGSDEC